MGVIDKMKIIVITSPETISGEVDTICRLLDCGIYRVHIRRPDYGIDEYRRLLNSIPAEYHKRLVIHDFFELCKGYDLGGIHLNHRNPDIPTGYKGSVSCSAHSIEEVKKMREVCDYVFLSPIFDSISKQGYHSAFSTDLLMSEARKGVINDKVFALGGVTVDNIPLLKSIGFGGAVLMGEVWKNQVSVSSLIRL